MLRSLLSAAILATLAFAASADEIPAPLDAPPPQSPEDSAKHFQLPAGFRLELVACEPLINEPSGVCWDERGRMFVCELHGYNLEGQLDIEALNRTGQLDRVVRRVGANEKAVAAARPHTKGAVKLLIDSDGDRRMDRAVVWADDLPPCYGLCPARGGVIVAAAPDIVYLADRDGDGKAQIRETLFTGFQTGALERGINCPQWGPDDWIYFGRGHGGGRITGPHLPEPVDLPNSDFRIRADGSAIEAVSGGTHTIGFAFTAAGDRFVISTRTPGIFVAPLAWPYLARNPFVAAPNLESNAATDSRVYPISQPHPWRTRRALDPGFAKFYSERYGQEESAANGYFTSACSPLVYQDDALPGLAGQLFACEPAQNLVTRANVRRQGSRLALQRVAGEEHAEFLASRDSWFHPIALAHGPDGALWIVDFYREIIEDYSAIPRYLQQQYGLVNGRDRGRIWRLVHQQMPAAPAADMSRLSVDQLCEQLQSSYLWRRQSARRLLVEKRAAGVHDVLMRVVRQPRRTAAALESLSVLQSLGLVQAADVLAALRHPDSAVRTIGLELSEPWLDHDEPIWSAALALAGDQPRVVLQLALSIGAAQRTEAIPALADLARKHAAADWMAPAILSGLAGRGGAMFLALAGEAEAIGNADSLIEPLAASIAARRDAQELSAVVEGIAALGNGRLGQMALKGLRSGWGPPRACDLSDSARAAIVRLANSRDQKLQAEALATIAVMKLESAAERSERLAKATAVLLDPASDVQMQVSAVAELAAEDESSIAQTLASAAAASTPRVREAILAALVGRRERLPLLLDALEEGILPPALLSAVQRSALVNAKDAAVRQRAARLWDSSRTLDAAVLARYAQALAAPRDLAAGAATFRDKCANCHQAHGVGVAVGPDLTAEFGRAEETILRDVLAPSEVISAGYVTYTVLTTDGRLFTGLLAGESATSILLLEPGGKQQVVLRNELEELRAAPLSLMPDDLARQLEPADVANVMAWLRQPARRRTLIDDNLNLASALSEGAGQAEFVSGDVYAGRFSLRVTPPQRYHSHIEGWRFAIREKPGPGEYRYLRFAWKTDGGTGAMLELAADGNWPPANERTRRYVAGQNDTGWSAVAVADQAPHDWAEVTRDLWSDFGDFTLTGIAPTAIGGPALFDAVELLPTLDP